MSDWTPVVDLVEKLNALAMEWDETPDRQACAGALRAVLSGQYDPREAAPDLCHGLDVPHVRGLHPDQCQGCMDTGSKATGITRPNPGACTCPLGPEDAHFPG